MIRHAPVLFEKALEVAVEKAKSAGTALGEEIVLVRDLRGRIRPLLPGRYKDRSPEQRAFGQRLTDALGAYGYPPDRAILYTNDLVQGDQILVSGDCQLISDEDGLKIWLLDRQIIGQDLAAVTTSAGNREPPGHFFRYQGGRWALDGSGNLGVAACETREKGLDTGSGPGISWRQQHIASSGLPAGLWHCGLVCRRWG